MGKLCREQAGQAGAGRTWSRGGITGQNKESAMLLLPTCPPALCPAPSSVGSPHTFRPHSLSSPREPQVGGSKRVQSQRAQITHLPPHPSPTVTGCQQGQCLLHPSSHPILCSPVTQVHTHTCSHAHTHTFMHSHTQPFLRQAAKSEQLLTMFKFLLPEILA